MIRSSEAPTAQPSQPQPSGSHDQEPSPKKDFNALGLIALIASVLESIFACIPEAWFVGGRILPYAFIFGLISLFLPGTSKWMGLVGLILSVVGAVLGVMSILFALKESGGTI